MCAGGDTVDYKTAAELTLASATVIASGWALGVARRSHRHYVAQAAEQRVRRAVADERLRIAREL